MVVGCVTQNPDGGMGAIPPPIQARNGLCQLPVFGPVALKMLNLLANQEAEVRTIAGLLRSDPALSAKVLAVANSSFYGTPQYIDNLARAILVLGFERTKSLTLTVALRSFTRHLANPKVMQSCWQHSIATALLAEELAPLYEIAKDRAYTAALIHDVGRLGLLRAYGELYAPLFAAVHDTLAESLEAERSLFQMDHCQAGLLLTQRWGFPSEYSRVAGCHHGELPAAKQDLVSLTHTACLLADALGFPAMVLAQPPTTGAIVAQLPANPWNPYTFHEEQLKDRIAKQIASVDLA
ncbi:MAG: HDOD domain-containing protein [Bryobacteraceae bacterium]|jgi:putative nucleotidyltransferase with HDIG domain